jgi:AP-3 complex subunit delta-1
VCLLVVIALVVLTKESTFASSELAQPDIVFPLLLGHTLVILLPPSTQSAYIQSASKIFGSWTARLALSSEAEWRTESSSYDDLVLNKVSMLKDALERAFISSSDVEVQERAAEFMQLLKFVEADVESSRSRRQSRTTFTEASSPAK